MRWEKSRQLYDRARRSLAGGVSSQVRLTEKPFPLFFKEGKGSRLYDVDGNEYIDYVLGQGPDIFGHAPDFLVEAVARHMARGQLYAGQHELEVSVSETIQRVIPSAELVRFSSSGSEAVHAALRLARAYTERPRFIKFEGQYHGWLDSVMYSVAPPPEEAGPDDAPNPVAMSEGLSPGSAREVIVLPWNDVEALEGALERHHHEVAAVITEPVMCNTNCIMPRPGYLEAMRELCDRWGVLLIFDEVITGFRLALGGAQEALGVTPDLSVFAKAMGGGFPISMVAGRREVMGLLEEGRVTHAGTVNSNVMVMAAARAALDKLMEDDGAAYRHLYTVGRALMEGLRDLARRHEVAMLVQGPGPVFAVSFTEAPEVTDYRSHKRHVDEERYHRFAVAMLERGVRLTSRGIWFVSTAHTQEDVDRTLEAAEAALASL